jgi:hypothetical protein
MRECRKKIGFFLKSHWTAGLLMVILNALFVTSVYSLEGKPQTGVSQTSDGGRAEKVKFEDAMNLAGSSASGSTVVTAGDKDMQLDHGNYALRNEQKLLHNELIEIIDRYRKQNESYRRLQLSIAATLASGELKGAGKREDQLITALATVSENGRKLALKTIEFCEYVDSILDKMPLGKLQKAALQLRSEELKTESRKFCSLADPALSRETVEGCRLLAVNDDLKIAVLPVGAVHGVFNGLHFYDGKEKVKLKVITVRPFISAAVLEKGNINDLTPGMEVSTNEKRNK